MRLASAMDCHFPHEWSLCNISKSNFIEYSEWRAFLVSFYWLLVLILRDQIVECSSHEYFQGLRDKFLREVTLTTGREGLKNWAKFTLEFLWSPLLSGPGILRSPPFCQIEIFWSPPTRYAMHIVCYSIDCSTFTWWTPNCHRHHEWWLFNVTPDSVNG